MTVHLEAGIAESCANSCTNFMQAILDLANIDSISEQWSNGSSFTTARQLGTVYSLFAGEDLKLLLDGFVAQAEAMTLLFAAAGGLIEAQDEALASALSKAAEEPAGLQSLGLINAGDDAVFDLGDQCVMGAYGRVGPEDVSTSSLERIGRCAEALQPGQYLDIHTKTSKVATGLTTAATTLKSELDNALGHDWQGEFALSARDSTRGLVQSAHDLSTELEKVSTKALRAHEGLQITRANVAEYADRGRVAQTTTNIEAMTVGTGPTPGAIEAKAQLEQAEEQARAIVNTEYSPAVMDANLDDLDFTTAYRVVSTTALGGPDGVDMARIWNTDGIPRPATAASPGGAALAAASGGAGVDVGAAGADGVTGVGGAGVGATTTTSPAPIDAATEQALLASRSGGVDGAGAIAASAGQAGSGGGVNASTTAAGAPFAPAGAAGGQHSRAGTGGIRGIRGAGASRRDRDSARGFGSAAGLVGGGSAAAAGAAASRLGGAGTLAGIGGGAGMSGGAGGAAGGAVGGGGAGAFGAGSAGAGAAGSGAGALSSSSSGTSHAGRAGAVPMGAMAGGANAGQNSDRKGHTPAGYLTNATNTTAIIGEPLKVSPAVLGRTPVEGPAAEGTQPGSFRGRVIGRDYTGRGAK